MAPIEKVIVAGATGKAIGPSVVEALVAAGFQVSILSRSTTKLSAPAFATVSVVTTDYTSASLEAALAGQDAVVSTVGFPGLGAQLALIDAAVAAGVKRFVPSEYGNDTRMTGIEEIEQLMKGKRQVLQRLREVGEEGKGLTWTALATGVFIDYALRIEALGFAASNHTATIYDSGNEPFTGTLLAEIGVCVARILQNPDETRNKYLRIRSVICTRNSLLGAFESETGRKWTVEHLTTQETLVRAREKLKKGDRSSFRDLLSVQTFQDGCGRGVIAKSAEEGEEGMKLLRPDVIDVDQLVRIALS